MLKLRSAKELYAYKQFFDDDTYESRDGVSARGCIYM